jgi:hypothetical protein
MKTLTSRRLLLAGLIAAAAAAAGSGPAAAATLTVCPNGCAFTQIAPAVAAANNGDSIAVGAGTYQGGFTIDKSVDLVGGGATHTVISGGGPVITIGEAFAASEPTVSISGVTITGGVTRSSPESVACAGEEGVFAAGGGIEVPPRTDPGGPCGHDNFGGGATVTITNSVITGNLVAPSEAVPAVTVGFPAFAPDVGWAFGGGIDTSGSLTLKNTTVSDNRIGSASGLSGLAVFAEGAGIFSALGDLTSTNSTISGNQAAASPHGVIADAAGIASGGTFTMTNSSVTDNRATVITDFVFGAVPGAGGIHNKGGQAVTISNTTISGNAATVTNSSGSSFAVAGGINEPGDVIPTTLSNDEFTDNSVSVTALPGSTGDAYGRSGAGEMGGTLTNVRLTGNTVEATSAAGNATAEAGATVLDGGTISNSLISHNSIRGAAPLGSVDVRGGGIDTYAATTLRNSTVFGNMARASGASGSARGGGIYDVAFSEGPDGPPGGSLALEKTSVSGNSLSASAGILLQGGGIFAQAETVTLTNSWVMHNVPDQCFGC